MKVTIPLTILLLVASSIPLAAAGGVQTFTGVIGDSMCGTDHKAMNVTPDSKCVAECVKSGSTVHCVLVVGKRKYALSDQKTPEQLTAQRVKVTGRLSADSKTIEVKSIDLVK